MLFIFQVHKCHKKISFLLLILFTLLVKLKSLVYCLLERLQTSSYRLSLHTASAVDYLFQDSQILVTTGIKKKIFNLFLFALGKYKEM